MARFATAAALAALIMLAGMTAPPAAAGDRGDGGNGAAVGTATHASSRPESAPGFGPDVRLNAEDGYQNGETTIAVDPRGNLYAGWIRIAQGYATLHCAYSRSSDGGATWSVPEYYDITRQGGDPVVFADPQGGLYRTCLDNGEIVIARSGDGGLTWGPWNRFRGSDRPWYVAEGNGTVLMVESLGTYRSQFRRSGDDGATWSAPVKVGDQLFPRFARDAQGILYAASAGDDAFAGKVDFTKSADGGLSWSAPTRLSINGLVPEIAVDAEGRNVYVIWSYILPQESKRAVFVGHSADGGATWDPPTMVNRPAQRDQMMLPTVLVDCAGTAHLAWIDDQNGDGTFEAWYSNSSDHGGTWTAPTQVSDPAGGLAGRGFIGHYTQLVVLPSGELGYLWSDNRGNSSDVWFSKAPATSCGGVSRVEVSPSSAIVAADRTLQFTATAYDRSGRPVPAQMA